MYRGKDRQTKELFLKFLPFDGKLDPENRRLKIKELFSLETFETRYQSYFSDRGRPALSGRLSASINYFRFDSLKSFFSRP